ncbi:MAG: SUMF1/EgtB/PvdO family nonheme iron enzyme [Chloroflexota bacterium]|nr:SUMF1/EgtB/PvdO family nonheme iron enzyme [Chloroflexota bacterium]
MGALDMSGNVWEWVSSRSQTYPYRGDDGREEARGTVARVLRGGSWSNQEAFARAASRYGDVPNYWLSDVGFRLAVSFPILSG